LTRWRTEADLESYLWIVERQKNTTIHFHLFANKRYDIQQINAYMRAALVGGHSRKEFEYDVEKLMKYNGVDIAKKVIRGVRTKQVVNFAAKHERKTIFAYVTKYVTKNKTTFENATFRCSHNVSALFTNINYDITDAQLVEFLSEFDISNVYTFQFVNIYFSCSLQYITDNELFTSVNDWIYNYATF